MYSKHFLKHIILVILLSQILFSSSNIKKIWVPIISSSDTIALEIILNGQNPITLTVGDTYIEAGATAKDNIDGNLNATITGSVDTTKVGTYTLTYTATDSAGNRAIKKRTIIVKPKEDDHYIHGGKSNNSGEGSYYPYDDEDAKRGLKFNADKAFLLHSVKVYNQVGEASTRIFSLFDSSGNKIASKKVIVPEGESRLVLDFKIPKGSGYTLMADIHKGLYRNTNVNGYPYAIGDVGSIISANESSTDYYYFFYDWAVEELSKIVSIDLQVSQGTDDADEDSSGNMNVGGHGDASIIPLSNDNKYMGFRFQNLNIPQGATITSATVEFTSMWVNNGGSDNPAYSIYGDNSNDAFGFDDVSHNISSRTKTASNVYFKTPDVAGDDAKYNTPNIKSIVQEIVDRKNWQSGNALALILQYINGNEWRAIKGYETHAEDAAVLHISYKLGGGNHQHPPSLSDYSFIGNGYGKLTNPSQPAPGRQVPYVPDLTELDKLNIVFVSPNGNRDGKSKDNPTTFAKVIKRGLKDTVVIALNGEYNINGEFSEGVMKDMNNVHIISYNKWGAKLTSDNQQIIGFPNKNGNDTKLSFIGFEAIGTGKYFIFASGNASSFKVRNIYLSDLKLHNFSVTIYSGLQSHDWTVDKTVHYESTGSYLWYMMGYHNSVINSVIYENGRTSIVIRGCFNPDEDYEYYDHEKNTLISERSKHFLADNDWTHLIMNNTFASNLDNHNRVIKAHVGIFYQTPSDEKNQHMAEDVYYPPKNILIANNVFVDSGPYNKYPVQINAERGINTGKVVSVEGIFIKNNYTDRGKIINPNDHDGDISSIDLSTNHTDTPFSSFSFKDSVHRDYHLKADSILIDKSDVSLWKSNSDNGLEYRDNKPDVGAFEIK